MKILLDECVPKRLLREFAPHECPTAGQAGLDGIPNGQILVEAERLGFELLVTVDQGISRQNSFAGRAIRLITLRSGTGTYEQLQPLVPECLRLFASTPPGSTAEVSALL